MRNEMTWTVKSKGAPSGEASVILRAKITALDRSQQKRDDLVAMDVDMFNPRHDTNPDEAKESPAALLTKIYRLSLTFKNQDSNHVSGLQKISIDLHRKQLQTGIVMSSSRVFENVNDFTMASVVTHMLPSYPEGILFTAEHLAQQSFHFILDCTLGRIGTEMAEVTQRSVERVELRRPDARNSELFRFTAFLNKDDDAATAAGGQSHVAEIDKPYVRPLAGYQFTA